MPRDRFFKFKRLERVVKTVEYVVEAADKAAAIKKFVRDEFLVASCTDEDFGGVVDDSEEGPNECDRNGDDL
jgi:hypothetical protein